MKNQNFQINLKGNHTVSIKGNEIFVDGIKLDVQVYETTDLHKLEENIRKNENEIVHAIEVLVSLKKLINDEKEKVKDYQNKLKEMIEKTKPLSMPTFASASVCCDVDFSDSWVKFYAEHFRVYLNNDYNISCYVNKVSQRIGELRKDLSIGVIQNKNVIHIEVNKYTVLALPNMPIEKVLAFFNYVVNSKKKLSQVIDLMNKIYKYDWSKDKFYDTYYGLGGLFIDLIDLSFKDEETEEEPEIIEDDSLPEEDDEDPPLE